MGENKMSYGLQQGLGKIPDSDSKVSRDTLLWIYNSSL